MSTKVELKLPVLQADSHRSRESILKRRSAEVSLPNGLAGRLCYARLGRGIGRAANNPPLISRKVAVVDSTSDPSKRR